MVKRVVVIDNDLRSLDTLSTLLGRAHYDVYPCEDAETALQCLDVVSPDAIILDEPGTVSAAEQKRRDRLRHYAGRHQTPLLLCRDGDRCEAPDRWIMRRSFASTAFAQPAGQEVLLRVLARL
jgi:hypothetical protein